MLFITHPNLPYRWRHTEPVPSDVCLAVIYENSDSVAELTGAAGAAKARRWVLSPSNRLAYLHLCLLRAAAANGDPLRLDTLAGEILAESLADYDGRKLYREGQLAWYAERVEAVSSLLDIHYDEAHTLPSLARSVGMKPSSRKRRSPATRAKSRGRIALPC